MLPSVARAVWRSIDAVDRPEAGIHYKNIRATTHSEGSHIWLVNRAAGVGDSLNEEE